MKKDVVIKVENLSKKYQIGRRDSYLTLRDQLMRLPEKLFSKKHEDEFWALKNVNFEVKRGEVVGIIGRNGAGKSTLLKILSRIVEPTTGKITMKGRVASLLEVGTGFNPELTGRENIYLNGAILGMSKQEIEKKFSEIVAFSGVEKFLDTPVKRYSSGMYVRLAFAVAAHLDADILLVDEVLAVGDEDFQKKCLGKMNDLAESGKTVIFVSHDMGAVTTLCKKTFFLKEGNVLEIGETNTIINKYLNNTSFNEREFFGPLAKKININKVKINGLTSGITINPSEELKIEVFGKAKEKIEKIKITLSIYNQNCRVFSIQDTSEPEIIKKGQFISEFIIKENLLRPDDYYVYVGGYQDDSKDWFYGERLNKFKIIPKWSFKNKKINIGIINVSSENKRIQ